MEDRELLERIALDPRVMAGKAVIKGTRLTVEHVLNMLAHGETIESIIAEYRGIAREDVLACVLFAARTMEDTTFAPLAAETA